MFRKLILSLLVILFALYQIDASCFIYPCDDKQTDAKCVNTTDHWVSKSNLKEKKYCECCLNPFRNPNMTVYPHSTSFRSSNSTVSSYNSTVSSFNSTIFNNSTSLSKPKQNSTSNFKKFVNLFKKNP